MGTFTRLDDNSLQEVATAFHLGKVRQWTAIAAGTVNSNFAIDCDAGRYFLRVNEGKQVRDVEWESTVIDVVSDAGLSTPRPLRTTDHSVFVVAQGKLCTVFPWCEGVHLDADEVTPHHADVLGAALADMHQAAASIAPAKRMLSRYDMSSLFDRFTAIRAAARPELKGIVEELAHEHAWLSGQSDLRERAAAGVIHGDLFRDNVLWQGGAPILLDFEQASAGSCVYDLAVTINDWCWNPQYQPALKDSLLAGYARRRPLTVADRAALPVELRASAMRFAITRITDVYLAGITNPAKDFRDYVRRLHHWQRLASEPAHVE